MMMRTVGPSQAAALVAAGNIDLVDVRDMSEWAAGHLAGSRNVPLSQLRARARQTLLTSPVIFVCARGQRSQQAAQLALELGIAEVYSLEGGIIAWERAGLPLEGTAPAVESPTAAVNFPQDDVNAGSCDLPEPGLEGVIGANLRELRTRHELSLDAVARITGLSRSTLGQIELGQAKPSVSVVWRIARAFDVQFSAMLASGEAGETRVLRAQHAQRLVSPDGRFTSRALFALGTETTAEFYELFLGAHSVEEAQPHPRGTRENLVVTAGSLELEFGGQQFQLASGDAIVFTADVPHIYRNRGSEDCRMYLVMTYGHRSAPTASASTAAEAPGK